MNSCTAGHGDVSAAGSRRRAQALPASGSKEVRVLLLCGELAACVQAVEVQYGVEDERVAAARLAAPYGIRGEHHDVPLARGNVYDGRALRDVVAAFEQAGDEEFTGIGVTEDHARAHRRGNHAIAVAQLFVGHRRILPPLDLRLFRNFSRGAAGGEVGILEGAASGGPHGYLRAQPAEPATANDAGERERRTVVAIGGERLAVAVGDGAGRVHQVGL